MTTLFNCPDCGFQIKCTLDNWRSLCCQNCGKIYSSKNISDALEKVINQKDATAEQKLNAKKMHIAILIALEKYSQLSGDDWVYILKDSYEYVDQCNWASLNGANWKDLLIFDPEYGYVCGVTVDSPNNYWEKITVNQWQEIAKVQPVFKPIADLVNGKNIAMHIASKQCFIKFCNWQKISGAEWVQILIALPEFASYCQWEKLDGDNWSNLLTAKPEYVSKCSWNTITNDNFSKLRKIAAKLRPYLNFADIPSSYFYRVVEKMGWGDEVDWSHITTGSQWRQILINNPGLSVYCNWRLLNSHDWVTLLIKQPQFRKFCQWNSIKSEDWNILLAIYPDSIVYYPKKLKDAWNYKDYSLHAVLINALSKLFVFFSAILFLAMFSFFSFFGEDGLLALGKENFLQALGGACVWSMLAISWAFYYCKNWAGEYKRWLQLITTFFASASFYTIYKWSFFFSCWTESIILLFFIAIVFLFLPQVCEQKAKKILLLLSPLFYFALWGILTPVQSQDYYKIGKQLYSKPFVFKKAGELYYKKGYAVDPELILLKKNLEKNIDERKWKDAEIALSNILKINSAFSKKQDILEKISELKTQEEKALAKKKREATTEALQLFSEKKYEAAYAMALQGDLSNHQLLLALGYIHEYCGANFFNLAKANDFYLRAAKSGDSIAECTYAKFLFRHPEFITKDKLHDPEYWFSMASQHGNHDAMLTLSDLFYHGKYVKKDLNKALNIILPIAKNNAIAARTAARIYSDDKSGLKNIKLATSYYAIMLRLFLEGAEEDNVEYLYCLGELFETGEGCNVAFDVAFGYFSRAASLKHTKAMLKRAFYYRHGLGTKENHKLAFEIYQELANYEIPEAFFELGRCFALGLGCEKSELKAQQWYQKAIKLHNQKAIEQLAVLHYFGRDVQDYSQAYRYACMAAEKGSSVAQFLLGNFYIFGRGEIKPDTKKAFEWYMKAAKQGQADAQYNIGYMYENGDAGTVNFEKAKYWYELAAKNGNARAKKKMLFCNKK